MYKSHVYIFQCHKSTVSQKPSMECLLQKRSLLQSKNAFFFSYLGPLCQAEHRPSMTPRQRNQLGLFVQLLSSRCKLFPLILFPLGFHLRACWVMLFSAFCRERPNQPHFCLECIASMNFADYNKIRVQVTLCQKWQIPY